MDKEQFERKRQWAGELKPSMKRRRVGHDYQRRCVYMITLAFEGRSRYWWGGRLWRDLVAAGG